MTKLGIAAFVTVALILMLAVMLLPAFAQPEVPEGVQIFYLEVEGLICILWPDGGGDCYCPCNLVCSVETRIPRSDPTPTSTPPPPQDTPTPQPVPTPKPKCNRGLGNWSEGCDPGNSGGKPGAAGEKNENLGPPGQRSD